MHRIALAGVKHSGKSTKGRLLAEMNGGEFHDLDDLAEALLPPGYGLRRWYKEKGREAFRRVETEALRRYLDEPAAGFRCLALGGGTLENPEALKLLRNASVCLCGLEDEEEVLYARILRRGLPPFLEGPDPKAAFHRLYEERSATIKSECDLLISTRGLSLQEAVQAVHQEIRAFQANHNKKEK